jgi:glycosyltransferase involved in cell wall biosynthesis
VKVSVVIPTYNRARLVGEAVRSVLAQEFRDLELVVVDDGSTDATPDVLRSFADPRLAIVEQPNQGIAAAWAAGLRRASAEYAIRLDSDDRFLPHCLARLMVVAEGAPDAVLVYGRARAMREDGTPLAQLCGSPAPFPDRTFASTLYGDFVAPSAALVRRQVVEELGGPDSGLGASEDWDLWVRLARRGRFVFLNEVLSEFRVHAERFTAPRGPNVAAVAASRLRVLDKAFAAPDLPADVRAMRALCYRNAQVDIALRWVQANAPGRAGRAVAAALRTGVNPFDTLTRVAYLVIFHRLVRRCGAATRVSDGLARWRRARRLRNLPSEVADGIAGRLPDS